jgi:arylsulfatase A-like enzyme
MENNPNSFRQLFRLVFVIFSLFLTGDALYRWEGFSYYASFYEFLPTVGLAFILWSFAAFLASILLWILINLLYFLFSISGVKAESAHFLIFAVISSLIGSFSWIGKKIIWPDVATSIQIKLAVFVVTALLSLLLTWYLRDKARRLYEVISERITPLVWIFIIFMLFSCPIVAYYTWFNGADSSASRENRRSVSAGNNRPNILLVTFDALSARDMSLYGYERDTTPFIRQWAENASVFRSVEASSNFTTPAAASLMTGKRVWTHQTYHIEGTKPLRSEAESLPSVLKDNGYFNIAIVVNPFASVRMLGMSGSFDIAPPAAEFGGSPSLFGWKFGVIDRALYRAFGEKIKFHNWIISNEFILSRFIDLFSRDITVTEVPPDKAFNRFLNIIDSEHSRPFFAWIHLFPPHDPYLPPDDYSGRFNPSNEMRAYKPQERLIKESYKYLYDNRSFPSEMQPSVSLMRDYYDEYIAYIDKEFGDFIVELNKRMMDNTVIILSSDHGESFEHGYFTHSGPFLFEQATNVPLIIKEPFQEKGYTISSRVAQVDISPTILDMAGITPPSWMEGRSLLPLMSGEKLPELPAFAMNLQANRSLGHQITKGTVAVWEGDFKLIHYLQSGESLLFNLGEDPGEIRDLFNIEKKKGEHLLGLLLDNLKRVNSKIAINTAAK